MPLVTLTVPLLVTIRTLIKTYPSTKQKRDAFAGQNLVWIILALYHAVVTVGSYVPFSRGTIYNLPVVKELALVILVWVQLSSSFGIIVYTSLIKPVLRKVALYFPATSKLDNKSVEKSSNIVITVLKMSGLLTAKQEEFLRSLLQDGVATVFGFIFLFTPTPIAIFGTVCLGLLLPAFRAASISEKQTTNAIANHDIWLRYWACVAVIWLMRVYGVNYWPSIIILATLWLQHTYFQGALIVTSFLFDLFSALHKRNEDIISKGNKFDGDENSRSAISDLFRSPLPKPSTPKHKASPKEEHALNLSSESNGTEGSFVESQTTETPRTKSKLKKNI